MHIIIQTSADTSQIGHVIAGDVADWTSEQVLDERGEMADMSNRT